MRVEIQGKEYDFEIKGTIGLMYKAETLLGIEEFDANNKHHQVALLYAAYYMSNKHRPDCLSMDEFMCSLTTTLFNTLTTYFWRKWAELEPQPEEAGGRAEGEG